MCFGVLPQHEIDTAAILWFWDFEKFSVATEDLFDLPIEPILATDQLIHPVNFDAGLIQPPPHQTTLSCHAVGNITDVFERVTQYAATDHLLRLHHGLFWHNALHIAHLLESGGNLRRQCTALDRFGDDPNLW